MTEPMDDEAWAAALRSRSADVAPAVPVDVPRALRRGRRRRAVRGVAVGGGALVAACGVVVVAVAAVPSLLGGLGSADSVDSAGSAPVPAAGDQEAGADAGARAAVTAPELASAVADGSLGAGPVFVVQSGVPVTSSFLDAIRPGSKEDSMPLASSTYPAAKWAGFMRPCLAAAGWEVEATDDGWYLEVASPRADEYLEALADCAERYPVS
ncbi:hypothetical protein [Cellulomonas sp. PhB150]|uniref:hypothetical protein n=1 Tax=Cellulomonas sp. PhB150 TaxID=2485188 RepID=UPI000FB526A2|nr:hypothetical protein [Cellulomonas sp. PhB150]ROS23636.1 hypothetical protein EDF34_2695 [Cellulomonas sp. PhB150]